MFEDKYKKTMENVKLSDESKINAEELIKAAKASKKAAYRRWISLAAACLMVVICIVSIFPAAKFFGIRFTENETIDGLLDVPSVSLPHKDELAPDCPQPEDNVSADPEPDFSVLCTLITQKLDEYKSHYDWNEGWVESEPGNEQVKDENMEIVVPDSAGNGGLTSSGDAGYSDTNNQVAGVQEGDVIKTDGKLIYYLHRGILTVFSANNGQTEKLSMTKLDGPASSVNMLLYNGKIVLIRNKGTTSVAEIYSVSEKGEVEKLTVFNQTGSYISCRAIGSKLYIVTLDQSMRELIGKEYNENIIISELPQVGLDELSAIEPDNICVSDVDLTFTVVSCFDIESYEHGSVAVMGGGSNIYADGDTLYVYKNGYRYDPEVSINGQYTVINRFSLSGEVPELTGNAWVNGIYLNQYSFDEHEGYLRVAVHRAKDNAVVVLNNDLEVVGEVDGLGINEQIESVRFYGDTAYVVTFRRTDPLYAIDLSDPENPTVLSELKVPGFSTYMQSYGEGKIFGFGNHANEKTGQSMGLKISMYDTSDLTNVKELHTKYFGTNVHFRDEVLKAVYVNPQKGLIMFPYLTTTPVDGYNEKTGEYYSYHAAKYVYAVYTYGENGFKLIGETSRANLPEEYIFGRRVEQLRGVYIGEYVYIVMGSAGGAVIEAYSLSDFTLTGKA